MEYIDGCTLTEIVERCGPLPNLVFLDILIQILSGLGSAHERGVCHRDIKPENIILDKNGIVHITDFGIAHLVNEASITLTGAFVGSPGYVSPEQVSGKNVTEKSDMFSLGSLCYVCVTGSLPFPADNPSGILHKVMNEEPIPPLQKNTVLIQWISDHIIHYLQKEPPIRPNTKEALTFIKMKCINDNLTLERERYSRFIKDPAAYNGLEKRELLDVYKNSAYTNFRAKKYIAALKNLNQMGCFGILSKEELRMKNRIIYRRKINTILVSVMILLVIIYGALFVFNRFYKAENVIETPEEFKQAVAVQHAEEQTVISKPDTVLKMVAEPVTIRIKSVKPAAPAIIPALKQADTAIKITSSDSYGYFDLRTNPPWVKVCIDDITIGETPKTGIIPLKTGRHTVFLEKAGFKRVDFNIDITEKDTVNKKIKMEKAQLRDDL
jgi:hypothetical protein